VKRHPLGKRSERVSMFPKGTRFPKRGWNSWGIPAKEKNVGSDNSRSGKKKGNSQTPSSRAEKKGLNVASRCQATSSKNKASELPGACKKPTPLEGGGRVFPTTLVPVFSHDRRKGVKRHLYTPTQNYLRVTSDKKPTNAPEKKKLRKRGLSNTQLKKKKVKQHAGVKEQESDAGTLTYAGGAIRYFTVHLQRGEP